MSETVIVNLDRRRPYRARQHDRTAIWVGPGAAEVPTWVAEAWGMQAAVAVGPQKELAPPVTPATAKPPQPWAGYDDASAAHIIPRLPELSRTERAIVAAYERAHKQRKTVLDALAQAEGD